MAIFAVMVFVFMQRDGHKIISPLEVCEADEPSEDVDGVLKDVCCEVGSGPEVRSVLDQQLCPCRSAQIKRPDVIIQYRCLLSRNSFTSNDDEHTALIVNAAVACPGGRTSANDFHFSNGEPRGRRVAVAVVVEIELVHVVGVLAFLSLTVLPAKDVDTVLNKGHGASDLGL